jgi:hypothetical protein
LEVNDMTSKNYKGGIIYKIPKKEELERIGYYHAKNGTEGVKSARANVKKLYGREPDIIINAELFNFTTRKPASDVVAGGVVHRLTEGYGFAFPDNKDVVFSYKNNVNAPDYIGAYPVLVRNGKAEAQNPAGITGKRGRTALGLDGDNLLVMLIPDSAGATLDDIRKEFAKDGAENAINLDGGGSTQYYSPLGNYISSRAVRGFIYIYLKKANGKEDVRTVKVVGQLRVRSGPGYGYPRIDLLNNGDKVTVTQTAGAWCKIGEGRWVHKSYLKK